MIGITNAGGGTSVGGKLTVTAPANTNVTAKLGDKVKTRNSGSGGSAVFKGLGQGSWDISIANAEQTVTIPVAITTDYFTTIAFFASRIAVTYPAGSTCTCYSGNVSYTAPNTSGSYTFTVPQTGTWTVKSTNGNSTASQNVSITGNGQSVSVTLSYWNGQLFDNGNQYTDHTGGWSGSNSTGGSYSVSPNLSVSGTNITAAFFTNSKVDVTKFKKLCFTGSVSTVAGTAQFGLMDHRFAWNNAGYVASLKAEKISNGVLDISAISGSYYINAHVVAGVLDDIPLAGSIYISKVWME